MSRTVGWKRLTFYGVGTMVGGGFYALSGKIAGSVGLFTPLAFALAGVLALVTALSFAELASRLPHAGGSARYVEAAFGSKRFAAVVGWAIIATGVVSASTLSVATVGFVGDLVELPSAPATVALVLLLGAIAAWGIREAVGAVVLITVIEVAALLYVAGSAAVQIDPSTTDPGALFVPGGPGAWAGVFAAAFLAFYAFIGFEDMVTLAEEVRDARSKLPRALIVAIVVTLVLYVSVSALVVLAVDPERLASASTPLAEVVRAQGDAATTAIVWVSILTGVNGALVQIVMASRVGYGMASRGYAPKALGVVSERTRTPLYATAAATAVVLVLALSFGLKTLAEATSAIILAVFACVNLGLWWMKREPATHAGPDLPRAVPLFGAAASLAVLAFRFAGSV
ncbi:MAG: APC family permease [Candidatus Wenzhouxiangella sp. M2_3B_020]